MLLRSMVQVLFVTLIAAAGYGLWYGYDKYTKLKHSEKANEAIAKEKEEGEKSRDGKITDLATKLQQAKEAERLASTNLQMSQAAVDQFLTQLLQLPAGLGLQAEISQKHVNDALAFCEQERPRLEKDDSQLPLRATNYFNSAQLLMRKNQ
jgi:hypothetical protein